MNPKRITQLKQRMQNLLTAELKLTCFRVKLTNLMMKPKLKKKLKIIPMKMLRKILIRSLTLKTNNLRQRRKPTEKFCLLQIVCRPAEMNRYNNLQPFEDTGRLRRLRWWLNLVFIIGAIVGMIWYTRGDHDTAIYIMIGAVVFKFIELTLRIAKL